MDSRSWEFATTGPTPWAVLGLLIALVCLGIWFDRKRKPWVIWGSALLRFTIVGWLGLVLFGLAMWQLRLEPQPGRFTLLVDQSASVTLRPAMQRKIQETATSLRTALAEQGAVSVMAYSGRGPQARWQTATTAAVSGGPTHMAADLTQLPLELLSPKQTLVLLTDGADHGLGRSAAVTGSVAAVVMPHQTVAPSPLLLRDVRSDAYALVRSPLRFHVDIQRTAPLTREDVNVRIQRGGATIGTTTVTFERGSDVTTATLDILPTQEGRQVYNVEIRHPDVEQKPAFHSSRIAVRVIRDRIRVLHVVGRPDWETRLLRENLKQDPAIDLVSFQILRTTRDKPGAPNEELSLIPFPTKELFTVELPKFDVVFFQNFNYTPYFEPKFRATLLQNLRNFVINDGGGFAMTAGDLSFGYGRYHLTPVRDILPVVWNGLSQWSYGTFRLDDGMYSDWFGAEPPHAAKVSRIYSATPKPEARTVWQSRDQPVFVVGTAGQGRTAALLTDHLWKLAYQGGPADRAAIAGFWSRLIRYLSGDPEFEDVHVDWQDIRVHPGGRIGGAARPATGTATIVDANGNVVASVSAADALDFDAPASATTLRLKVGDHAAPEPLIVQHPLRERTDLGIDHKAWQQWREVRGIPGYDLDNWRNSDLLQTLQAQAERVTQRSFVDIQSLWWYWLVGLLLILAEIAVRRFGGLP